MTSSSSQCDTCSRSSFSSSYSSDVTTSTTSTQRMKAYFLKRKEELLRDELAERIWQRHTAIVVVIFLFVAIVALVWIIIYGGIQPDGLVLAVHKITVDTSKTHRPVVDPNLSTPPPTTYSTPRPIRGTVPPRSKWGPYDRYRPRPNDMIERTTAHHEMAAQNEILVENWAKKVFNFKIFLNTKKRNLVSHLFERKA